MWHRKNTNALNQLSAKLNGPEKFQAKEGINSDALAESNGSGIATDKIMVEGQLVDYMNRDEPQHEVDSGMESDNSGIYDLNTIANYDPAIIPYLDMPEGTELERIEGTDEFQVID